MARPAQWKRLCLEPSDDDRKAGNPIMAREAGFR